MERNICILFTFYGLTFVLIIAILVAVEHPQLFLRKKNLTHGCSIYVVCTQIIRSHNGTYVFYRFDIEKPGFMTGGHLVGYRFARAPPKSLLPALNILFNLIPEFFDREVTFRTLARIRYYRRVGTFDQPCETAPASQLASVSGGRASAFHVLGHWSVALRGARSLVGADAGGRAQRPCCRFHEL